MKTHLANCVTIRTGLFLDCNLGSCVGDVINQRSNSSAKALSFSLFHYYFILSFPLYSLSFGDEIEFSFVYKYIDLHFHMFAKTMVVNLT